MINIGIICPSEIALRRFLPSLIKAKEFSFVGIAIANPIEWFGDGLSVVSKDVIDLQQNVEKSKAQSFVDNFGGKIFHSYEDIILSDEIDAIYIPLPPALHYEWCKLAIENGKHVFVEKPATTEASYTASIISIAREKKIALHENYMFTFHNQLKGIDEVVSRGEIGDVRLYRISFGFPRRALTDFRYNKKLGGGALLDAGGYTIKYASYLLGNSGKIVSAGLNYITEFPVDIFGTATMINEKGLTAQLAFGMDNDYKCDIEIWGSKGTLISNRILTAPDGFTPNYQIKKNQECATFSLPADDAFLKSIIHFKDCIINEKIREENYMIIQRQADLLSQFKQLIQ